jgi:hypothetical protein
MILLLSIQGANPLEKRSFEKLRRSGVELADKPDAGIWSDTFWFDAKLNRGRRVS